MGSDASFLNNSVCPYLIELDKLFYDLDNILLYKVVFKDGQFFVQLMLEDQTRSIAENVLSDRFKQFFKDQDLLIDIEKVDVILPKRRGKYASVVVE